MASGLAAAAHGGFTTVCAMPNTTPAADEPGVFARVRAAAAAVRLAGGAAPRTARSPSGGEGSGWPRSASWPTPASSGFSDDGSPVTSPVILRNALLYAGMLGCRSSSTPRTRP